MKYFDEMRSKYGFSDGEAIPGGVDVYRKAYVLGVNQLADENGSNVRCVAFDRSGMHNWCLILFVAFDETLGKRELELVDGSFRMLGRAEAETDAEFEEAILAARAADVDQYIQMTAELDEQEFGEWLDADHSEKEEASS